jgi:hypothetical protein
MGREEPSLLCSLSRLGRHFPVAVTPALRRQCRFWLRPKSLQALLGEGVSDAGIDAGWATLALAKLSIVIWSLLVD